ncbi:MULTISPECIES: hypothetical protein [Pseudomonas]|uniref:Peptidase C58 YopT-type domain-containing protein n=1 Tax=Pseudomonas cucumis TaxID=2954082 RepID=A0ABY9EQI3_9PSED|nr:MULTISPECIES: hypothetical protein [Pseudomonas]MDR8363586.1 hypothetical protein [Pseudomonas sp. JL3]URM30778.1 hypothetical protein LLY42_15205 [Pseudomonas frederiksbergensis]WLG83010.1 hypothetical protein PSH97_18035 [Pseudomonas cucumis]WLG88570.1 hypothetical protein PSH72_18615 [Pseudomonas cucumis]
MPLDRTCFSHAKEFASFDQGIYLGIGNDVVVLTMGSQGGIAHSETVTPVTEGMCWAYCCQWVLNIKANKRYLVKTLDNVSASELQRDMMSRHATSDTSNALRLALGGLHSAYEDVPELLTSVDSISTCLNRYATGHANFLMLTLKGGTQWAHAVVLKLNQSSTGGYLNWSYPCAMFDPNIGQGMYNNHADMAADVLALNQAYSAAFAQKSVVTSVRAQLISYSSGVN